MSFFPRRLYGASIKDVRTLGREKGLVTMRAKMDRGGKWLGCKRTSFSVRSLEERRGHLKVILSTSCVEDLEIKRQTRNKNNMNGFFEVKKIFIFP